MCTMLWRKPVARTFFDKANQQISELRTETRCSLSASEQIFKTARLLCRQQNCFQGATERGCSLKACSVNRMHSIFLLRFEYAHKFKVNLREFHRQIHWNRNPLWGRTNYFNLLIYIFCCLLAPRLPFHCDFGKQNNENENDKIKLYLWEVVLVRMEVEKRMALKPFIFENKSEREARVKKNFEMKMLVH